MSSSADIGGGSGVVEKKNNPPRDEEVRSVVRLCQQLVQYRLANYNKITEMKPSVHRMFEPFQDLLSAPNRLCLENLKMIHFIARGGFGRIWKVCLCVFVLIGMPILRFSSPASYIGECEYEGKVVAVKEPFEASLAPSQYTLERDLLLELKHKRIVKLLGFFYEGKAFYVLEFCLGALHKYTAAELGLPNIFRFIYQSFEAVAWIHNKGYIHRDIKPENFLITTGNNLVLADFGIAHKLEEGSLFMVHDFEIGTCDMLDPPALLQYKFGYSTDVFGLGCGWFEVITGKPLLGPRYKQFYDAKNTKAMWKHHAEAFELGRIKEKLDESKNYVPIRDEHEVFVREPINLRIENNCPVIRKLLKLALDPNPDNRPTASGVLSSSYMKDYLRMTDVPLEEIDSGGKWRQMTDKTKSSHADSYRHQWPKVLTDVEKYSLKPNTPKWWNFVTLSPLYYDGLNELEVSTKVTLESRSILAALPSSESANTANKTREPIPTKTGAAENAYATQQNISTSSPIEKSGLRANFRQRKRANQPITDADDHLNYELLILKRLKLAEHAEASELTDVNREIGVNVEIPAPLIKNADSENYQKQKVSHGAVVYSSALKVIDHPGLAQKLTPNLHDEGSGLHDRTLNKNLQKQITAEQVNSANKNEQVSTKSELGTFSRDKESSKNMTAPNGQESKNDKPSALTEGSITVKKCKIANCVGVFRNGQDYKQHVRDDHPGILICEYCIKFLCKKQVKLQNHVAQCKKNHKRT